MKIPLILIKSKTHIDSDLYDMRVNGDWHEFSKQDLKDLRSLIDTVLGEECAVCNPEWEGKQPIPLCEKHDEEILGQLCFRHGGENHCLYPICLSQKGRIKHIKCKCNACKPQESNKEEIGKGCYTDKLGQLVHDIPHTCQEPSKKPSERIEEFAKNSVGFAENIGGKVDGIIKILDELHESGKI